MHLPAFIAKAISFFDSAESKLDALSKYQSEAADLHTQIAKLTAESDERAARLVELSEAAKAAGEANAAVVADLKAQIAAESRKANDVIAGQGIPAANLPALTPSNADASKNLTLTEQCLAAKKKTLKK